MGKFGVFTALTLSWVTASCAERMVSPPTIPAPPQTKASSKPRPNEANARHRAEANAEPTGKRSTLHSQQAPPGIRANTKQPSIPESALPQAAQQSQEAPIQ